MTRSRPMTFLAGAAVVPLIGLAVAGCGGGGGGNASASKAPPKTRTSPSAVVKVANSGLGKILVDSQGRTLYLFKKDSGTKSTCTGACAAAWPPLRTNGTPTVGSGANASMVGTTTRTDGNPQVTYNGHPLYTFIKDNAPGDTNGQGLTAFGGSWSAVSPAGNPVSSGSSKSGRGSSSPKPAAPATPKASPPSPSNGIPQNGGGDGDADNNGGPDDGDGGI